MKYYNYLLLVLLLAVYGCSNNDDQNIIEASGIIEATYVTVSSKGQGEILKLLKDEGDQVNEGDTVMIIDHETLFIQLRQAEAGLKVSEAQYSLLKNGARKEDIIHAEEMLKQAETNYKSAEKDKVRFTNLLKSNAVSYKQFEDASAKYDVTTAQYNAARENLNKLNNLARPEELLQAEANVEKAFAAADLLRKNIKDSYIISPVGGIITRKYYEKGETVNQMSSLFRVADLNVVELVIYVSGQELGKVKTGQTAEIRTDSYDKNYTGKIIYISPEAEFTPKNIQTKDERTKLVYAVKIKIDNPDYELKPGMPADARIHL
jgi:HlyD family secretion protein